MNRDDIIRMACEAGAGDSSGIALVFGKKELMNFAALIAEDCAKRCEAVSDKVTKEGWENYAVGVSFASGANVSAAAIREAYKP